MKKRAIEASLKVEGDPSEQVDQKKRPTKKEVGKQKEQTKTFFTILVNKEGTESVNLEVWRHCCLF